MIDPETEALDQFWTCSRTDEDRLTLLRRFATIRIPRPPEWSVAAVRREATPPPIEDDDEPIYVVPRQCFCCRTIQGPIISHHVIQVQHGGSNRPRNRVMLCDRCHQRLHPWLTVAPRGFERIIDWAKRAWRRP